MDNKKDMPSSEHPPILMTFPKDEEITGKVIQSFIEWHQKELPRYKKLMYMYKNMSQIFDNKAKEKYKPDNRLSVNFPKFMTDTFVGFFNGIPIKKTHKNEGILSKLSEFDDFNDMEDEESELAKMSCIYGRAYEYMYQDENTNTCVIYNSPENMFIVYDDSIKQAPFFAVRYGIDSDRNLTGELITETSVKRIKGTLSDIKFVDETFHNYNGLPVIEYFVNEERMSIYESVISLKDAYDKIISEKANDVDYFSDQYLAFLGAEVDTEDLKEIRENRIINYFDANGSNVDVRFLDKPDSDSQTENILDRLEKLIYQTSMIANISDESFGNASGTSLAYKLEAMSNLAYAFQRKFQSSLNKRYKLFFSLTTNVSDSDSDEWKGIEYRFTRNVPKNILEEAQTAAQLMGITSEETALSVLSVVDDVQSELKRIDKEKSAQPIFDFEKSE